MQGHKKRGLLAKFLGDGPESGPEGGRPRTMVTFEAAGQRYLWSAERARAQVLR